MAQDLLKRIQDDRVKFICLQFTDVTGTVKSTDMPADRLHDVLANGVWFDGSSVEGFARIQESDMLLRLDPDTYRVLPWSEPERKRARILCDIHSSDGAPFPGDPRGSLKRMLAKAREKGWLFNTGPEPEFFLFRRDGNSIHPVPHDSGSYFDFSARDEAQRVRSEIMMALQSMGLDVEMGHHEVALGQHEIDFKYADALVTADNVITLKYTAKAVANVHNLTATFMPKPVFGINGSGMHTHMSIFDKNGGNIFFDAKDEFHLSPTAYAFMAGLIEHARGLCALVAPSVNSYKRIVPGYEAPVFVCWAQVNRSALIRIPRYTPGQDKATRIELRYPDPSCNPYLAFAAMLAAGMDGVERKLTPPAHVNNVNIYHLTPEEVAKRGIPILPGSLAEALEALAADSVLQEALGKELYEAFVRAKAAEWEDYRTHVTDWEIGRYLENA
ncbi:MAG: glutamine synthetase [Anaerolineales bacterium]|nr:glutamine synthetase [Anaerolineales bacterium]